MCEAGSDGKDVRKLVIEAARKKNKQILIKNKLTRLPSRFSKFTIDRNDNLFYRSRYSPKEEEKSKILANNHKFLHQGKTKTTDMLNELYC